MASSPFGCNNNSLFAKKMKTENKTNPPEPVELIADKSQIITAVIPFGTKQAANIRAHMHSKIVFEGKRMFIYRQVNGWTNIALESTEAKPLLTVPPCMALKVAYREFNDCAAVSDVTIKWKGSTAPLTYEDIDGMESEFTPLPADGEDDTAVPNKSDGEAIYELVEKLDDKINVLEIKLIHIATVVENVFKVLDGKYANAHAARPDQDDTNNHEASGSTDIVDVTDDKTADKIEEPATRNLGRKGRARRP